MFNFSLQISNVINLIMGVVFGFFIMIMLSCVILSKVLKKHNKNDEIREISSRAYTDFYLKKDTAKDKIISSLIYEIKEVTTLIYPDKKNPLYELSINNIIDGINLIQKKLKKVVNNPLCKDIKKIHIAHLLTIEEKVIKPVSYVTKKKYVKILMYVSKVVLATLNLINPVFYMKKIMKFVVFKRGKKDLVIVCLDFVGNTAFEIYNPENNLQNQTSTL